MAAVVVARRASTSFHRLLLSRTLTVNSSSTVSGRNHGTVVLMLLHMLLRVSSSKLLYRDISRAIGSYMFETRGHFSTFASSPVNLGRHSSMICMFSQKRWASQAASPKTVESPSKISIGPQTSIRENDEKDTGVVYYGPISSTIKKVKLLSLSTCCLSVSLGPVITFMTSPDLNVVIKGAVASTVILMSASTTAALHWFVTPYIHKLKWQPGSDSFEVEMMSWMASYIPRTIKFSDIRPAETNRPYVSFKANDSFYFIDAEHCHNKALLQKLTPQKPLQSAFKDL